MRIALIIGLLLLGAPGHAEEYIAVTAEGHVEAVPDTLTLSLSVRETGRDVEALQRSVDRTTQQLVAAAGENGVEADDIDSSRLSVRPEYQWRDGQRAYLGQTVQREVTLKLRKLDRYGALVQALGAYKLEEMRPPRLSHSQLDALKLAALDNALARGFVKAERIAKGIDAELGKVIRVEEQGAVSPPPMPRMMAAESAVGGTPEIQFGKQRISASVSMRFAIN